MLSSLHKMDDDLKVVNEQLAVTNGANDILNTTLQSLPPMNDHLVAVNATIAQTSRETGTSAAALTKVAPGDMVFRVYPRPSGWLGGLARLWEGFDADLGSLRRIESLLNLPALQAVLGAVSRLPAGNPHGGVELRAAHLPQE